MYSCISSRCKAPSYPLIPGYTPLLHTPTSYLQSPATALALKPIRERKAYKTLIKDDGQPSYPIKPRFKTLDKLKKYDDIISY